MKSTKHQNICPGCFRRKEDADICNACGFDESARGHPIALPYWTLLNRQYLTGRVLGKLGGFGITYLAWDTRLEVAAAVKEFLPRDFAGRDGNSTSVVTHSEDDEKMFRYGLKMFLSEAKTLAKFDHPNIVRVRNVFENNGTAYLVMEYLEGLALSEYLSFKRERMDEAKSLEIMLPVLDGLEHVHEAGFLHRDIKPHNLYLTNTGRTILLDFGAARQAIGNSGRSRSIVLTPGYAPFEQYHRNGNQGPWSDIYAFAAVLYHMVTGIAPAESTERIAADHLVDPSTINPRLSAGFSAALMKALSLRPEHRPQSVKDFRQLLIGSTLAPIPLSVFPASLLPQQAAILSPVSQQRLTLRQPEDKSLSFDTSFDLAKSGRKTRYWVWGLAVLAIFASAYPAWLYLKPQNQSQPAIAFVPERMPQPSHILSTSSTEAINPNSTTSPTGLITIKPCSNCPQLTWVKGGEFWMGSGVGEGRPNERPRHLVRVNDFAIAKYEVTQGQWRAVMDNNPALFFSCGEDCPVDNVSWNEIQEYFVKLNEKTGLSCRLPTEAEWEYACRSGGQEQTYCGGDDAEQFLWHEGNAKSPKPVGTKRPNTLGLYDMSGNVWEWTNSLYKPYPYLELDGREEHNAIGQARVIRGGFWGMPKDRARAVARSSSQPDLRNLDLGFRVVCVVPKPEN